MRILRRTAEAQIIHIQMGLLRVYNRGKIYRCNFKMRIKKSTPYEHTLILIKGRGAGKKNKVGKKKSFMLPGKWHM